MIPEQEKIQNKTFRILQDILGPEINLANWLSDILALPTATAYRIKNGESNLSLEQSIQLIKSEPRILPLLLEADYDENTAFIRFKPYHDETSFQAFLLQIEKIFSSALEKGDAQLSYIARDLPLFFFLARPKILEYKFAFWCGTLRDHGPKPLSSLTHTIAQRIYNLYLSIDSIEIWHPLAYYNQILQITTAKQEGSINEEAFRLLSLEFKLLLEQFAEQLLRNEKNPGVKLNVFNNTLPTMDNCGILKQGDNELVMAALPIANFFSTRHPKIVSEYRRNFTLQQHRSLPISRAGRTQRQQWLTDLLNPHWLLNAIKEHETLWITPPSDETSAA
tara:strand:- start:1295 stop:2299 length:1005 start_codon:yes stop_codon:yes gene_type:complete